MKENNIIVTNNYIVCEEERKREEGFSDERHELGESRWDERARVGPR